MGTPILYLSQKQLQLKTVDIDSITTADDTFTTLYPVTHATTPSARRQILNGSGSGGGCLLADATTFALYDEFEIFNNSSEVQIIKNSDLTLFEFLVPRATAIVKCTDIGTAAGSWGYLDDSNMLPKSICLNRRDDHEEVKTNQSYKMTTATPGSGSALINSGLVAGSYGGCALMRTNSSSATAASLYYEGSAFITLGEGAILIRSRLSVSSVGANPDELIAGIALADRQTTSTPLSAVGNSVKIRLRTLAPNNSPYWRLAAWDATTETMATLGLPASPSAVTINTWYNLAMVLSSDGTRVDGYVDGQRIGYMTSGLPTTLINYQVGVEGLGSGTLNRYVFEDYHTIHQNLTTKR